jgi:hypothetical protein
MPHPKQSASIHVEQLGHELCIYDWQRKEVHALNPTAARVWQLCDGHSSPAQIAATLQAEVDVPAVEAQELVWLTLARLEKAHLLTEEVVKPAGHKLMPRREFLKLGIAAALLPVVHSIVAPTPVEAQSPVPTATPGLIPTVTPGTGPTATPTSTAIPTATPTPTNTLTPTETPTPSDTPTPTQPL